MLSDTFVLGALDTAGNIYAHQVVVHRGLNARITDHTQEGGTIVYTLDYSGSSAIPATSFTSSIGTVTGVALTADAAGTTMVTGGGMVFVTVTVSEEHEGEFAYLRSIGGTSPFHFPEYRHYYDNVGPKYENLEVEIAGVPEGRVVTVSDVAEFVVVTLDFTDGPLGGTYVSHEDFVVVSGASRFALDGAAPVSGDFNALQLLEARALGDHNTWAVTVAARGGDGVRSQVFFSPYDEANPHFEDTSGNPSDGNFGDKLIAEFYVDTAPPIVMNEIPNQIIVTADDTETDAVEVVVRRGQLAFDPIALAGHFSNIPGSNPAMLQPDLIDTFEASATGDPLLDQLRFRKVGDAETLYFEADLASDVIYGIATVTITATDGAGHTVTDAFLVTREEDPTADPTPIEFLSAAKQALPLRIGQDEGYVVLAFSKGLSDYSESGMDSDLVDASDFDVTAMGDAMGDMVALSVESYGVGSERVSLKLVADEGTDHTVYTLAFASDAAFTGENEVAAMLPTDGTVIEFTVDTQAPVAATTGTGALADQTMAGSTDLSNAFTDGGMLTYRVTDENEGPYDASISGTNLVLTARTEVSTASNPPAVMGIEQITVTAFDEVGNATRTTISAQNSSGALTGTIGDVFLTDPERGTGTYFASHEVTLSETFTGGTNYTFFVGESDGMGSVTAMQSYSGAVREQADVVRASVSGNTLRLDAIAGAGIGVEAVTVTAVDSTGKVGTAEFFVHLPGVELKEELTPFEVVEGAMATYTLEDGTTKAFWGAYDAYVKTGDTAPDSLSLRFYAVGSEPPVDASGPPAFADTGGSVNTRAPDLTPADTELDLTAPQVFGDTVYTIRIEATTSGGTNTAGMGYSSMSRDEVQVLVTDSGTVDIAEAATLTTTVYDVDDAGTMGAREATLDLATLFDFATGDQGGITPTPQHFSIDYYIEAAGEQVSETTRVSIPDDGMVEVHLRGALDNVAAEHILNNDAFTLVAEARFAYGNDVVLNSVTLTSSEHNARTEIYNNSFVDSDDNDFLGGFGFDIHRGGDSPTKLQGQSIARVGDYNDDGFDDFVFVNRAGKISVVRGGRESWSVRELPNSPTYETLPSYTNIAGGDFNGDGFGDVLASQNANFNQLVVRPGRADGTSGPDDYELNTHNNSGSAAVAVIGDINGDGIVDTAISYRNWDTVAFAYSNPARGGRTDIYEKGTTGNRQINDFGIREYPNEHGEDGIETVRAPSNAFYTFLGLAGAEGVPTVYFGDLPESNAYAKDAGSVFYHASISKSGASVSGIGDINGDGIDDFAIGTPGRDANSSASARDAGAVFVIYGMNSNKHGIDDAGRTWQRDDSDSIEPVIASSYNENDLREATQGFLIHSGSGRREEHFGAVVDAAGDFNGDGYQDIVIGNDDANNAAKRVVVFFGRSGHTGRSYDAADQLEIVSTSQGFGKSVSGIGDFNGDGFDDILVGDTTSGGGGGAYIFFGQDETRANLEGALWDLGATGDDSITNDPTRMLKLSTGISGTDDTAAMAANVHHFGNTVEGIGDFNGDGLDDLSYGDGRGNVRVIWGNKHFGQPANSDQSGDPYNSADAIDHISDPIGRGDVVYAGAGGDTLYLNSNRAQRIDGGSGVDTLVIGRGVELDLTQATDSGSLGRDDVRDIEKLKFYANSGSVVKLDKFSLYDLTATSSHVDIDVAAGETITGRFLTVEREGNITHDRTAMGSEELQLLDSHFYKEEKDNGDVYYIRTALGLGSSNGYNEFVGIWAPDAEDAAGEDNSVFVQEVAYL